MGQATVGTELPTAHQFRSRKLPIGLYLRGRTQLGELVDSLLSLRNEPLEELQPLLKVFNLMRRHI